MGLVSDIADLLFPRSCPGCGAWDTALCSRCARDLIGRWARVESRAPYLMRVVPLGDGAIEPIIPVWAAGEYIGERRAIVVAWKNRVDAALSAAVSMAVRAGARHLAPEIRRVCGGAGIAVVPAPSRRSRIHDGRFVAGHIARAVVAGLREEGIAATYAPVLRMDAPGGVASGRLAGLVRLSSSLEARRAKTRGIRAVAVPAIDASEDTPQCLLVDDVLTTGATLAGCVNALKRAGATACAAVVLAVAHDPRATLEHDAASP